MHGHSKDASWCSNFRMLVVRCNLIAQKYTHNQRNTHTFTHFLTHTYRYVNIYLFLSIFLCVRVCVCVCVSVTVSVCSYMYVRVFEQALSRKRRVSSEPGVHIGCKFPLMISWVTFRQMPRFPASSTGLFLPGPLLWWKETERRWKGEKELLWKLINVLWNGWKCLVDKRPNIRGPVDKF